MSLNIIFVTQFFPWSSGQPQTGGTISNRNFLRTLSRRNDVTVLSFDAEAEANGFENEPYRVVHFKPPPWAAVGLFLHWQTFVQEKVAQLIESNEPPHLIIATTSTLNAFDVAPLGAKCVAIVQAFENFGLRCPWVPFAGRIDLIKGDVLRRFQDVRFMRRADAVLTNSVFMRDAIAQRFRIDDCKIYILRQQIDFLASSSSCPEKTVGFVHRGADKNIAFVLELANLAPDLQFLVYGHEADIPNALPPNVSMKGWAADRSEMFASAAIWLVPSLWAEPFGRVSIEAQAAGRAVLVANRGGLPETVAHPRFMIEGFVPLEWLTRIRELLSLPNEDLLHTSQIIREAFSAAVHDQTIKQAIDSIVFSTENENDF